MKSYNAISLQKHNFDDEFKNLIKSFQQQYQTKVLGNKVVSKKEKQKTVEDKTESTSLLGLLFKEYDSINDLMKDFSHQLKSAI